MAQARDRTETKLFTKAGYIVDTKKTGEGERGNHMEVVKQTSNEIDK